MTFKLKFILILLLSLFLTAGNSWSQTGGTCGPGSGGGTGGTGTGTGTGTGSGSGTGGQPTANPSKCSASSSGSTSPASQGPSSEIALGVGNPINLVSGNKYQTEIDMPALPGELGLEIVRHYNSHYSGLGSDYSRPSPMGNGWRLSYDTYLHESASSVQILQADGTRLIFAKNKVSVPPTPLDEVTWA